MTKGPAWGPFASQLRRGSRSPALVLVVVDLARDALPERVALVLVGSILLTERVDAVAALGHALLCGLLDVLGVLFVLLVHLLLLGLRLGGDALAERVAQVLEVLVGQRLLCLALLRGVLERILALVRLFLGGGGHALAESIPAVLVRSVLVTERGLRREHAAPLEAALLRGVSP